MSRLSLRYLACCVLLLCACSDDPDPSGPGGGGGTGNGGSGNGGTANGGSGSGATGNGGAASGGSGGGGAGNGGDGGAGDGGAGGTGGANNGGAGGTGGSSNGGAGGTGGSSNGGAGGDGGGDPGQCGDLPATAGTYFMALSTELSPQQPVVFLQSVTANANGLTVTLQPLAAADRTTPVGAAIVATFPVAADGSFTLDLPGAVLPAEANPITATQALADLHLEGTACPASFCGTVTGHLYQPIDFDLTSSTFRAERVMGMAYPEPPPIDCAGTLADPL